MVWSALTADDGKVDDDDDVDDNDYVDDDDDDDDDDGGGVRLQPALSRRTRGP